MKDQALKPLTYILWKWQDNDYSVKYTAEHVNVMAAMLRRHTKAPHRIICITDDPAGIECETWPLWGDLKDLKDASWPSIVNNKETTFPSCSRRLKIFSPAVTEALGIKDGERVVSVDLDMVITDTLDPLFEREDDFVGWHDSKGGQYDIGFNGSIWMFRAGSCGFLWDEFDPHVSPQKALAAGYYGDDQGWLSYRLYDKSPAWTGDDGIRRYLPELGKYGEHLLEGTRVAVFPGRWKPWHENVIAVSRWITAHYHQ